MQTTNFQEPSEGKKGKPKKEHSIQRDDAVGGGNDDNDNNNNYNNDNNDKNYDYHGT